MGKFCPCLIIHGHSTSIILKVCFKSTIIEIELLINNHLPEILCIGLIRIGSGRIKTDAEKKNNSIV